MRRKTSRTVKRIRAAAANVTGGPVSSLMGAAAILAGLAAIWLPAELAPKVEKAAAILAGGRLLFTRDNQQ